MSLSRAELMQAIVWGAAFAARAREYEGEDSMLIRFTHATDSIGE